MFAHCDDVCFGDYYHHIGHLIMFLRVLWGNVPRRGSLGGAYRGMASRSIGADIGLAPGLH